MRCVQEKMVKIGQSQNRSKSIFKQKWLKVNNNIYIIIYFAGFGAFRFWFWQMTNDQKWPNFVNEIRKTTVNFFRKMSTLSGKRLSTFSGKCQRFQEIKPTPTPPKEEGRFNLYKGLEAIHSTLFRGCTHTWSGVKRVKVSKSKSI